MDLNEDFSTLFASPPPVSISIPPSAPPPGPANPISLIEAAALDFHRQNPHVLDEIVRVSLNVKRAGHKHWSINAAFEVVRYERLTTRHKTYKLNNNHRACYARWIMRDVPELVDFFSTRDTGRVEQEYFE